MGGYRTVRVLAEGGMGRVELVVRQEGAFRRAYALKRLRAVVSEDAEVRAMFTEEARIAGLLHHPNVVSVIDVGEDDQGPYLVMDYVQGVSFSELLRELSVQGELMPEQIALRIFIEVARGLFAAHELVNHEGERLDLVHRDVSPQNILVGFDGVARLTDFGIAKARVRGDQTSTGILKGKIGYFAPEQLRFRPVTPQTDLFALGVVLFEALSGRRLYPSRSAEETARRILEEPPPDLYDLRQDLHPALTELLFRLLAKKPEKRPSDAAQVATDLEAILVEVLAAEAPMSVREFLKGRFAGHEERERALIEAATTRVARPKRRWGWLGASAAGVVVVGAIAYAALYEPAPAPAASFPRDGVAQTIATPPPPSAASADPGEVEAPAEAEAEPEPSVADTPAARRRRRRRRAAPPSDEAAPAPAPADPAPAPREEDELMGWGP